MVGGQAGMAGRFGTAPTAPRVRPAFGGNGQRLGD